MNGPLSAQAQQFLAELVPAVGPTDFSDMAAVRAEAQAGYAAASNRAIARHGLERVDEVIAGVECERIRSSNTSPSGTLFYVFGGGFTVGDPFSDLPVIGALAERCRVEVVAPRYRLAPEHPAPAAIDDCRAVYRRLVDRGDAPRLLAGESAGGNLALLLAQGAVAEGLPLPAAVALLSPATDLRRDRELFEPVVGRDPTLGMFRIDEVADVYVAGAAPTDPAISPAFGSMAGLPPTIITTGTRDLLMPMCLRTARAMIRAGVEVDLRVWDGLWHVFEFYDDYPEAAESLAEIAEFLNRYS